MEYTHRVRAIICTDKSKLILIKRIRPGQKPYWVMPGGGIEETDPNLEAALKREVNEELGADVDILKLVFELTRQTASNLSTKESFFLCALRRLDPAQRNGPEFSDPERGEYIIDELLLDSRLLLGTNIKPDELKDFLAKHWAKLFTLPDLRA